MLVTDRRRFAAAGPGEIIGAEEKAVLETALAGGVGALQLREKDLDGGPLFERARILRELCDRYDARLLVNDRVDVALAADADGVHLPAAGLSVAEARALLPEGWLVGVSTHSEEEVGAAQAADYIVFGPIFDTPSKRGLGRPHGLEVLGEVARRSAIPLIAIGGIGLGEVTQIRATGAAGIAVLSAILDVPESVASFVAALSE